MNADQAIRNGTDLMLVNYATEANDMKYTETAGAQQKLRQSAKRILYVVANSRQYSELGIEQSQQPNRWETILKVVDLRSNYLNCLGNLINSKLQQEKKRSCCRTGRII